MTEQFPVFPGAFVEDLIGYAKALKLPPNWREHASVKKHESPSTGGQTLLVYYEGHLLAEYELDLLCEISKKTYHRAFPQRVDPLVVATRCALAQPQDPEWRRFKHLVFRLSDVSYVNNVDKDGRENGRTFTICFKGGKEMVAGNERDYEGTGLSTCEFFQEHVLGLAPKAKM